MSEFRKDDLKAAKEHLALAPPRPWTNPWHDPSGEVRDANGTMIIGTEYYDGPQLAIEERVAEFIVDTINDDYPRALAALEEAWKLLRVATGIIALYAPPTGHFRWQDSVEAVLGTTDDQCD